MSSDLHEAIGLNASKALFYMFALLIVDILTKPLGSHRSIGHRH